MPWTSRLVVVLAALFLVAASPPPAMLLPLFQPGDYPPGALARGEQGVVVASLRIDPTGRVEACSIVQSSHSPDLDLATCEVVRKRAKFRPWEDGGRAVYAVLQSPPITWQLGAAPHIRPQPDEELELSAAPAGLSLPIDLSVSYLVKANGKMDWCKASVSASVPGTPPVSAPAALVPLVCSTDNLPTVATVRNSSGIPVDAVYIETVRLVSAKP